MAINNELLANEKESLNSIVTGICKLAVTDGTCNTANCKLALNMIKHQYNITRLDIPTAMLELKTRSDVSDDEEDSDKIFTNMTKMIEAISAIQEVKETVLSTLKSIKQRFQ